MRVFGTDYDGIVVNIEPQKAKVFASILNKYWRIKENEAEKFWMTSGGTSRKYKFDYLHSKQFNAQLQDNEYAKIESEFSQILKEKFYPNLSLLPGSLELLEFARFNFNHTFVSSGMPMEEIQFLTRINGVSEYFDSIWGTNNKFPSKVEHFKTIISQWGPDKIIFTADSAEDMRIAKEAKAIPIGILTNNSQEKLKNAGAERTCTLQDAITAIKSLI